MTHVSFPKPARGSHWLEGRKRRADQKAAEESLMRAARLRDGDKCRWPSCEFAPKKPRREVAHLTHRGIGGNPALDRTQRDKLITLCFIHHGLFDAAELDIEPMTSRGTDGAVCFYRRHRETGQMQHVFTEPITYISETRGQ